jgi:hypothetical protein
MKYYTGDSAEINKNDVGIVRESSAWYSDAYCIKTFSVESILLRS